MAAELWKSNNVEDWNRAVDEYEQHSKRLQDEQSALSELDSWYLKDLPAVVRSRNPMYMTHAELSKLMQWKLTKGTWRPRLQGFINALSDEQVQEASKQGFAAALKGDLHEAMKALTELKGVGPATASAMLSVCSDDYPFMSDEAMAVLSNAKTHTAKVYEEMRTAIVDKARSLGERKVDDARASKLAPVFQHSWTPLLVQLALWSAEAGQQAPRSKGKRPGPMPEPTSPHSTQVDQSGKQQTDETERGPADEPDTADVSKPAGETQQQQPPQQQQAGDEDEKLESGGRSRSRSASQGRSRRLTGAAAAAHERKLREEGGAGGGTSERAARSRSRSRSPSHSRSPVRRELHGAAAEAHEQKLRTGYGGRSGTRSRSQSPERHAEDQPANRASPSPVRDTNMS